MLAFLIRNVFIADELTSSRSLLAETLRRFAVHSRRLTQWVPAIVVGETPPMAHSEHRCRIVLWPVSGGSLAPSTTAGYIALAFALAAIYIHSSLARSLRSHRRFARRIACRFPGLLVSLQDDDFATPTTAGGRRRHATARRARSTFRSLARNVVEPPPCSNSFLGVLLPRHANDRGQAFILLHVQVIGNVYLLLHATKPSATLTTTHGRRISPPRASVLPANTIAPEPILPWPPHPHRCGRHYHDAAA